MKPECMKNGKTMAHTRSHCYHYFEMVIRQMMMMIMMIMTTIFTFLQSKLLLLALIAANADY